jgi:FkbM family methyltransferase
MLTHISSLKTIADVFATHPLSCDSQMEAWARFVSWQVNCRIRNEMVVPWVAGQKLVGRRGMLGMTGNIYLGLDEFEDMILPLHFLCEGDLFLDIGANVGSYTVLASGARRATTWAFEPDPDTASYLRRNVALNDLEDRVTIHQCAVGATDGEVFFSVGLDTTNKVVATGEGNVRRVRQARLDSLIGDARPIMMKVDVEQYEEDVVRGATGLLANPCLKVVEIETVTAAVEEILRENGFERAHYDPFARSLMRGPSPGWSNNQLFVRDWELVEARLAAAEKITVLDRLI